MHWPEEVGRRLTQTLTRVLRNWVRGQRRARLPYGELLRRGAVTALGLAAAACLIATEFATISTTGVLGTECGDLAGSGLADGCRTTGAERHGFLLVVLGLLAGAMAWGAGRRASRPAALALAITGVVTLAVALIIDLPTLGDTGTMGQLFDDVETNTGMGFWLELVGGGLALAAGLLGLLRRRVEATQVAVAATALNSVPISNGRGSDAVRTHVS